MGKCSITNTNIQNELFCVIFSSSLSLPIFHFHFHSGNFWCKLSLYDEYSHYIVFWIKRIIGIEICSLSISLLTHSKNTSKNKIEHFLLFWASHNYMNRKCWIEKMTNNDNRLLKYAMLWKIRIMRYKIIFGSS